MLLLRKETFTVWQIHKEPPHLLSKEEMQSRNHHKERYALF